MTNPHLFFFGRTTEGVDPFCLTQVGLVRQCRRTWTACNLVAHGLSKSHSFDVPHGTQRYKNLQLENTDVVEIQLPDEI